MLSTLKWIIILIASGYVVVCGMLYVGQRKLLYFPQPASNLPGLELIQYSHHNVTLHGWVVNPGQNKALIYYGGNAEQIEYNAEFFHQHAPQYTVYLIAYRGYGNSEGLPSEKALYEDAAYIFKQLQAQYEYIAIMGRSLGTGIATYIAANFPIERLVLVSPYDSIEQVAQGHYRVFPIKLLIKDRYPSFERAPLISAPTYIAYAQEDNVVPASRTENLIQHFNQNLLTIVKIAGVDHGTIVNSQQFEQSVAAFLR